MPGQARVGDKVMGCSVGVIVTGSPDVITNNRGSARAVKDIVIYPYGCGICTGHSPDVMIDNLWSHRLYDYVVNCCYPPMGITITASPDVIVN